MYKWLYKERIILRDLTLPETPRRGTPIILVQSSLCSVWVKVSFLGSRFGGRSLRSYGRALLWESGIQDSHLDSVIFGYTSGNLPSLLGHAFTHTHTHFLNNGANLGDL